MQSPRGDDVLIAFSQEAGGAEPESIEHVASSVLMTTDRADSQVIVRTRISDPRRWTFDLNKPLCSIFCQKIHQTLFCVSPWKAQGL